MKLVVDRKALINALSWAKRVVPEMENLVLHGDVDQVIVQLRPEYTQEHHYTTLLAEVTEDGTCEAPRDDLLNTLNDFRGATVTLEHKGTQLTVITDDGKASLHASLASYLHAPSYEVVGSMKQDDLLKAVQAVKEVVGKKSEDGTGDVLKGYLAYSGDKLSLYSTNRFTTYRGVIDLTNTQEHEAFNVGFVPLRWGGNATQLKGTVQLIVGDSMVGVKDEDTFSLMETVSPDRLTDIIGLVDNLADSFADNAMGVAHVSRTRLQSTLNSLKKQKAFSELEVQDESVVVRAHPGIDKPDEFLEFESTVDGGKDSGNITQDMVFSPVHLTRALKAFKSKEVQLILPDDSQYPIGVYGDDSQTLHALTLVMRLRVED